jgi:hypothetical protein
MLIQGKGYCPMVVPIIQVFGARIVVLGVVPTKPSATKLLRFRINFVLSS